MSDPDETDAPDLGEEAEIAAVEQLKELGYIWNPNQRTWDSPRRELVATDDEVRQATLRHCVGSNDEIEIDEPARVSRGEDGPWVQAWVFVPRELVAGYAPG